MSASQILGDFDPRLVARGSRQPPNRHRNDRDPFREERESPHRGDRGGEAWDPLRKPRRHGKHGSDRVRRQGTRRSID
jgi:hypothetical protein